MALRSQALCVQGNVSIIYITMCMDVDAILIVTIRYNSFRIKQVKKDPAHILDVDGGCLAQKWHRLSQQGLDLQSLPVPQTSLAFWRVLNQQSIPV